MRLHNYRDKMGIMEAARRKKDINIGGKRVYFFQDFSVGVQKRRAETAEIRKRFRGAGIKYAFIYPATIKVLNSPTGKVLYLYTVKDAETFLNSVRDQWTTEPAV